jgi:uncharacterized protein YbjT (DUF2867 family)
MKILITGATGNVGMEVIKCLGAIDNNFEIVAGVRDIEHEAAKLKEYLVSCVKFDFTNSQLVANALVSVDLLFLLRPPQLSNVKKYFAPLIASARAAGVKHIVFLSVQGVEKSTFIPHYKIEKLIVDSGIGYTFLRPAYFMQNFTTSLREELIENKRIFLPAGNAKFTLIDVHDIGEVAARVLCEHAAHLNKAYELTNYEQLTFQEMADKLSIGLGVKITYVSPNLLDFFWTMRKKETPVMLILVMIMLHYFPRFQTKPTTTNWVRQLTNVEPISFDEFTQSNKRLLIT